jgi:hypothetical protein
MRGWIRSHICRARLKSRDREAIIYISDTYEFLSATGTVFFRHTNTNTHDYFSTPSTCSSSRSGSRVRKAEMWVHADTPGTPTSAASFAYWLHTRYSALFSDLSINAIFALEYSSACGPVSCSADKLHRACTRSHAITRDSQQTEDSATSFATDCDSAKHNWGSGVV